MKQKKQGKQEQPKVADKNQKNKNGQIIPEPEEVKPPEEKPKNIEKFIYVTKYSDSETMKKLRELFEEINQPAFELRSVKEVYTRELSEEERDNNEIDYISGYQLIDKTLRITIIEGITGKAMVKVKEKLPKYQMNTATFKYFADTRVLFNKRIYSKFNLCLKFIKLRDTLNHILTTYDIYTKSKKYPEIYNAFVNFGGILKADTMESIYTANLFSNADDLLYLERKYSDILTSEDMTGIHVEKKKKKKKITETAIERNSSMQSSLSMSSIDSSQIKLENEKLNKMKENEMLKQKESGNEKEDGNNKSTKPKLDSHNLEYENFMKDRVKLTSKEIYENNLKYIKEMKKKGTAGRFIKVLKEGEPSGNMYLYAPNKENEYVKKIKEMASKYIKDKDHYYTYSLDALTMSFPLVGDRNEEYYEYMEGRKKWVGRDEKDKNKIVDFDRYKQFYYKQVEKKEGKKDKKIEFKSVPYREYAYLPKIANPL